MRTQEDMRQTITSSTFITAKNQTQPKGPSVLLHLDYF